jgi:hypothetical protein
MINARADTVAVKPAFRSAFKKGRCLIVADGFYEWKKTKQPFFIRLKDDEPFAFAAAQRIHGGAFTTDNISRRDRPVMESDPWAGLNQVRAVASKSTRLFAPLPNRKAPSQRRELPQFRNSLVHG